jgi:3-mercaptopyruvate sulfurtransferase SseA
MPETPQCQSPEWRAGGLEGRRTADRFACRRDEEERADTLFVCERRRTRRPARRETERAERAIRHSLGPRDPASAHGLRRAPRPPATAKRRGDLSAIGNARCSHLVDVRAAKRYSGESEPIDAVAGHIPTAINLPATANLEPDGRFLPPAEIAKLFAEAGGGEGAVLYCGSGITAAHGLLALESAGLTAAIYPGSWSEWIRDASRPVATGTDP